MDVKANAVAVGLFAVVSFAGLLLAIVWVGQFSPGGGEKTYRINFTGSVSGLNAGGAVTYNGLKVGGITSLHLDLDDPRRVIAIIEIDGDTPVTTDVIAQIQYQGLTGVANVDLIGSGHAPILKAAPGEIPVIASKPSDFQTLFATASRAMHNADRLFSRLSKLIDANESGITSVVSDAAVTMAHLAEASQTLPQIAGRIDDLAGRMHPGLEGFSRMVEEGRRTIRDLDSLIVRLRDDPARFVLGDSMPNYNPETP